MLTTTSLAATAALVGDPARAGMLAALMDGRPLTASELAAVAGVTPQTASGHLAQLTGAGLLARAVQGRHRYFRLATPAVAQMLEGMMLVASGVSPPRTGPRDRVMRQARTCYDHLAGRLAVAIADSLAERGHIELSPDGAALTDGGTAFLRRLGVPLEPLKGRTFCRPCLDWSERRPHIAGTVGTALCRHCFDRNWISRVRNTRAVTVTPAGQIAFRELFGVVAVL
jgi:DNA-binding transcriptional ArsR family regulator